jgi:hypothetical protein
VCARARAFGVCKYMNASESRQIEKKERARERESEREEFLAAENEWETHTNSCVRLSIMVKKDARARGKERKKGERRNSMERAKQKRRASNGRKQKYRDREIDICSVRARPRGKKRNRSVWKCV